MKLGTMAGIEETSRLMETVRALDPLAPADYRELAAILALDWKEQNRRIVGISGGQGAGKSTLGRLIEAACAENAVRACVLSLDDFYLTRSERQKLAAEIHPLFETRGPPGTHDLAGCSKVITSLLGTGETECPRFDKGLDDCGAPVRKRGPFDLVVLEGWCVGAEAQRADELDQPVNELEAREDGDAIWRGRVNDRLSTDYQELWTRLESTVFLEVPGLAAVRRWRLQQERWIPEARRIGEAEVARFVQFFERMTNEMLLQQPSRAEWVVSLAEDHSVAGLTHKREKDERS